ncbi:MAG: peptidase M20, partial [Luminiphilus sp.]|nr:peptidase M20 [Luminiphilus sp.]
MRLLLPTLFALFWSLQSSADQHPLEISAKNLSDIVKVMASDHFEGRAPGTPGEDKTVAYLIAQMQKIGLEP